MIIYKVTNKINNRCYIGQTIKTLKKRKQKHLCSKSDNNYFHNALKKYGSKNFNWEIIDNCISKNELDEMEFHYIRQYNTLKPNGYNLTLGGAKGTYGWKPTNENKKNISKGNKKWWNNLSAIDLEKWKKSQLPGLENKKRKIKLSVIERFKNPENREKQKIIAKNLWKNPEYRKTNINSRLVYIYELVSPKSKKIVIYNMSKFCKENGLSKESMLQVCDGKRKQGHHKGWKAKKIGLING